MLDTVQPEYTEHLLGNNQASSSSSSNSDMENQRDSSDEVILQSDIALFREYTTTTFGLKCTMDNEWALIPLGITITLAISVAASPLITSMLDIAYFTSTSMSLPIMICLSKYAGELKDKKNKTPEEIQALITQTSKIPRNGLVTCLPSWLIIAPALCFSESILLGLGQNRDAAKSTQQFFRCFTPFYLFFSPRLLFEFSLVNFKKRAPAIWVSISSLLMAMLLGYLLVFVFDFQLNGLAIANGTGVILTAIGYGRLCQTQLKQFDFFKHFSSLPNAEDHKQARDFLIEALPVMIVNVTDVVMGFVLAIFAGQLGTNKLEIQNGATQFLNLNYFILAAATQTMIMKVSDQKVKATSHQEKYTQLQRIIRIVILSTLAIQALPAIFFSAFPETFTKLVGSAKGHSLQLFFCANAAYALLNGISFNLLQAMRTLDDMWVSSAGAFVLSIIGAALSYFLSQKTSLELTGLPIGVAIGASLNIAFLVYRFSVVAENQKKIELPKQTGASNQDGQNSQNSQNSHYVPGSLTNNSSSYPATNTLPVISHEKNSAVESTEPWCCVS